MGTTMGVKKGILTFLKVLKKINELQAVRREHLEETAIELAVVTAELRASVKKIQVTVLMDVQQDGRVTFATKVHTS